jgi:hypothetical protein
MAKSDVIIPHIPGLADEAYEECQTNALMSKPRFEPETSRSKNRRDSQTVLALNTKTNQTKRQIFKSPPISSDTSLSPLQIASCTQRIFLYLLT